MSPRPQEGDELIHQPVIPEATPQMCYYCIDVLIHELSSSGTKGRPFRGSRPVQLELPSEVECPLFVTWEKKKSKSSRQEQFTLRGCIGSLSPKPLSTETLGEYALSSSLKDYRFDPIQLGEVPDLRVGVSLLVRYEECSHPYDWQVGRHGILIKFQIVNQQHSATYLPEVAHDQGWTQRQAVDSLIRKSGYRGTIDDSLLERIQCTRYQSSKHRVEYQKYVAHRHDGVCPLEQLLAKTAEQEGGRKKKWFGFAL